MCATSRCSCCDCCHTAALAARCCCDVLVQAWDGTLAPPPCPVHPITTTNRTVIRT